MKHLNKITNKAVLLAAGMMMLLLWLPANAQVQIPFTQRTSTYTPTTKIYNIKGDFQMIGNTNITTPGQVDNGNISMTYVDVDNITSTLNSSSATLELSTEYGANPECSNIIYAGLYWLGRAHDGGTTSPNTFSVTKTVPNYSATPTLTTVNYNGSPVSGLTTDGISHNEAIPNTSYTLTISRMGTTLFYPRYTFTSNAGGPTVIFESQVVSTNYNVRYSTDNGASWTNASDQVVSNPYGTNRRLITFTPVAIYNNTDGTSFTVNSLFRDSRDDRTETQTIEATRTFANVTVKYLTYPTTSVTKAYDKSVVYLKHASKTTYTTITAADINFTQNIYYPTTSEGYMYSAYAEVTDYVRENGLGEYTVADIALNEGNGTSTGFFGGWGMIVVYENSKMKWRDVTIFDGYAYVQGNTTTSFTLPVSGFRTAQSGDISMKLGLIAGEGDSGIAGDYFEIIDLANNWVRLNHDGNTTGNFFNSSIPAPNPRNPQYTNNTGVDIAMFNIDNTDNYIITNNQTSTTFRYGSTQDTYVIPVIAMAVDAYIPDVHAFISVTSLNGSPVTPLNSEVLPGEEIEYKLDLTNPSEPVINGKIVIPIPYTAEYISSSAVYFQGTGGASPAQPQLVTSGASKFIEWYIGNIPTGALPTDILASMTFKLEATDDCFLLVNENCSPKVLVQGSGSGTGLNSGAPFTNLRFIHGFKDGICQDEPILGPLSIDIDATDFVNANCGDEIAQGGVQTFSFCQNPTSSTIAFNQIAYNYPEGTRFYNAIETEDVDGIILVKPASGAIEYTSTSTFPNTLGTITYYALPAGLSTCWWEFEIEVEICNLWYGGIDTDWGKAGNWTQDYIPLPTDDVFFATTLNWSSEAQNDLKLDQDRSARNIVNYSSKRLIIPVNTTLTVDDDCETGSASKLIIESEVGQANGALVLNNPTGNTGIQATVEFASKSKPGTGTWPRVWQFFGPPVVDRTLTGLFGSNVQGSIYGGDPATNVIVRKYNEALNLSYSYQEKWEDLDPALHMMLPYYGYEITQPIENTKHSFAGTLVTDLSNTLSFSISPEGTYARGNYILANPYAAPIYISNIEATDLVNLAPAIYIYNTGSRQNWISASGESQLGSQPGTYTSVPVNSATTIDMPQIPSMQAFMVKALSATAPETKFTFRYDWVYKEDGDTTTNRAMRVKSSKVPAVISTTNSDIKPLIKMDVIGENGSDRVYLITAAGTGKAYDAGWDGYKTLSTDNVQLFALDADNKRMQVNTDNDLNETFIGFRSAGESSYTLRFTFNNEMQGVYESLYVQDLATGIVQEITDGMTMTFAASPAGATEKRFKLTASKIITGVNTPAGENAVRLAANSTVITVENSTGSEVRVTVYNLVGQPILTETVPNGVRLISHKLMKGTYVIEAKSINNSSRVILKSIIQ